MVFIKVGNMVKKGVNIVVLIASFLVLSSFFVSALVCDVNPVDDLANQIINEPDMGILFESAPAEYKYILSIKYENYLSERNLHVDDFFNQISAEVNRKNLVWVSDSSFSSVMDDIYGQLGFSDNYLVDLPRLLDNDLYPYQSLSETPQAKLSDLQSEIPLADDLIGKAPSEIDEAFKGPIEVLDDMSAQLESSISELNIRKAATEVASVQDEISSLIRILEEDLFTVKIEKESLNMVKDHLKTGKADLQGIVDLLEANLGVLEGSSFPLLDSLGRVEKRFGSINPEMPSLDGLFSIFPSRKNALIASIAIGTLFYLETNSAEASELSTPEKTDIEKYAEKLFAAGYTLEEITWVLLAIVDPETVNDPRFPARSKDALGLQGDYNLEGIDLSEVELRRLIEKIFNTGYHSFNIFKKIKEAGLSDEDGKAVRDAFFTEDFEGYISPEALEVINDIKNVYGYTLNSENLHNAYPKKYLHKLRQTVIDLFTSESIVYFKKYGKYPDQETIPELIVRKLTEEFNKRVNWEYAGREGVTQLLGLFGAGSLLDILQPGKVSTQSNLLAIFYYTKPQQDIEELTIKQKVSGYCHLSGCIDSKIIEELEGYFGKEIGDITDKDLEPHVDLGTWSGEYGSGLFDSPKKSKAVGFIQRLYNLIPGSSPLNTGEGLVAGGGEKIVEAVFKKFWGIFLPTGASEFLGFAYDGLDMDSKRDLPDVFEDPKNAYEEKFNEDVRAGRLEFSEEALWGLKKDQIDRLGAHQIRALNLKAVLDKLRKFPPGESTGSILKRAELSEIPPTVDLIGKTPSEIDGVLSPIEAKLGDITQELKETLEALKIANIKTQPLGLPYESGLDIEIETQPLGLPYESGLDIEIETQPLGLYVFGDSEYDLIYAMDTGAIEKELPPPYDAIIIKEPTLPESDDGLTDDKLTISVEIKMEDPSKDPIKVLEEGLTIVEIQRASLVVLGNHLKTGKVNEKEIKEIAKALIANPGLFEGSPSDALLDTLGRVAERLNFINEQMPSLLNEFVKSVSSSEKDQLMLTIAIGTYLSLYKENAVETGSELLTPKATDIEQYMNELSAAGLTTKEIVLSFLVVLNPEIAEGLPMIIHPGVQAHILANFKKLIPPPTETIPVPQPDPDPLKFYSESAKTLKEKVIEEDRVWVRVIESSSDKELGIDVKMATYFIGTLYNKMDDEVEKAKKQVSLNPNLLPAEVAIIQDGMDKAMAFFKKHEEFMVGDNEYKFSYSNLLLTKENGKPKIRIVGRNDDDNIKYFLGPSMELTEPTYDYLVLMFVSD